jgi:hypothetical protein
MHYHVITHNVDILNVCNMYYNMITCNNISIITFYTVCCMTYNTYYSEGVSTQIFAVSAYQQRWQHGGNSTFLRGFKCGTQGAGCGQATECCGV